MAFQTYSDQNPPRHGNSKRIYLALKAAGFEVRYLKYNPNCWMKRPEDGWATWSCSISDDEEELDCWCGWDKERGAYLQGTAAPFRVIWLARAEGSD
jgi:hypothetical protein